MILIIDNYDSFTYNLYQLIGKFNSDIKVVRNDKITLEEIEELNPSHIIISPGPGNPTNPDDFGICGEVILKMEDIPILGICLGHQGIFYTYGGSIIKSKPVHGKNDTIKHSQSKLFEGVPEEFDIIRYHSLICDDSTVPSNIKVTARNGDNIIMAIEDDDKKVYGLQFHPESIGAHYSDLIIQNFLKL